MIMNYKYPGIALMVLALASCGGGGGGGGGGVGAGSTSSPGAAAQALGTQTFPSTCYSNTSPGSSINTFGGFAVSSNIWNPGSSVYTQCTSASIQSPGGVTSAEFDWNFASSNSNVKTYPNIQFGRQNTYRASTTPLLPALISALPSLNVTGNVTTTCIAGPCYYDSAFDMFFSSSANSWSGAPQGEVMVMLQYNLNGDGKPGNIVGSVTIGGITYNVQKFTMQNGSNSWPYVAYYPTTQISQMNLNIASFVADAVNRGYISGSYYLDMVSFGTEIQTGQGVTNISNYNIQ